MDVTETSWEALQKAADDKDGWRARVRTLKKAARGVVSKKSKIKSVSTTHQLHSQRFTFFQKKAKKRDRKPKKKTSNAAARTAHYDRLTAPAVAQEKMYNLLCGHLPAHKPTPTTTRPPPLPTWDTAVAAVFSDNSSFSTCGSPTYDYDSNADFIPKSNFPPWAEAAPSHNPQTPIRSIATTTLNNTSSNTPNDNSGELWAQSLPSHMLPSPQPSTFKASHHSILHETEPWAKSLPSHMLPSPSPPPSADSQPYVLNDLNHTILPNNIMNDTLRVSMSEPNPTEPTNTDSKLPILYNRSQRGLVLTSLQSIPLSPILPPPPTTNSKENPRNKQ